MRSFVQLFFLKNIQILECNRCGYRMSTEGISVVERRIAVLERLVNSVTHDGRSNGGIAAGHALRTGDHVRHVAILVAGEHVTNPSERADALVAHQQHIVLVTDLAPEMQVSGRRRDTTE